MALGEQSYYNITQTAAMLGVSRVTVSRWIRDGRLPILRLGHRTTRIAHADMERLLKQTGSAGTRSWDLWNEDAKNGFDCADMRGPRAAQRVVEESEHSVQFYETDAVLFDAVADFLGTPLREGDAAIAVMTAEHRSGLEEQLRVAGLDLAGASADGRYVVLDAAETLAQFIVDGMPDPARFTEVIGAVIAGATTGGRRVRVFGEMVNLLAVDGNTEAAIRLEELWNGLIKQRQFLLLCAYQIDCLGDAAFGEAIGHVCAAHSRVVPAESYSALTDSDARDRAVAMLQQKARRLEGEIAERRRAEERLREALVAEKAARAATEAALSVRDEFLAIAAHELRTPVSGLSMQAQLLLRRFRRDGRLEPEQAVPALEAITRQSAKLVSFVDRLLDLSRLEAGKLALERHSTDLSELVGRVVDGTRVLSNKHPIALDAPTSLDAWVDGLRLEQVLANLVDNAVKFSPGGELIEVALSQPAMNVVELSVQDRGLGIPLEKRGHIFDRFHQAHGDGYMHGLGLGLYVSRQIVELHGGEIRAEFPEDGGTRMVVCLPLMRDNETTLATAD